MRNIIKNPSKFIARVIPQAVLKLVEGLGYVGSMLTSIGSDNYWADVADNHFSNWLEGLEQKYKDQIIPVYKQAGFDSKGFFSKLVDWSFWNDSVADSVAFMASAAVPGFAFSKIGALSKFGQAFSTASKLGKVASTVGLGSWAELSSWTFNTAMEASMEGSQVFKEMKKRMEDQRAQGLNDLSDDQIRERAGNLAANTVAGNFAVLGLSNAWENTLFFKPFKNVEGRASLQLGENFVAGSRALNNLEKGGVRGAISPLGRATYYGKKMAAGFLAEGLWEENAQLAIQRINQDDNKGRNFFQQLGKQTIDAFAGRDEENLESIGLGALIGMGASVVFSKAANERREVLLNTREALEHANTARQNLFTINDIYKRADDNSLIYEDNKPKIDPAKLASKQEIYEKEYGKLALSNEDDYFQSEPVKFETRRALANYVRSLHNVGVKDISGRLAQINPKDATLFGMNPADVKEESKEFSRLASSFEDVSNDVAKIHVGVKPAEMTDKDFVRNTENRKAEIYTRRSDNVIVNDFIRDNQSEWLTQLNKTRNLQNASLAQFPVDQLNQLIQQQRANEKVMKSPEYQEMSELEQTYHKQRAEELKESISQYKTNNELTLKDSRVHETGFYIPTITDSNGTTKDVIPTPVTAQLSKNIANYTNVLDKNNHIDNLISDRDEGLSNYLKYLNDGLAKQIEKAIAATQKAPDIKKYKELKQGDFQKVTQLVAKMVFGENNQYSPEELELQKNYAPLIEELLPQYEGAVDEQRLINMRARLATLRNTQAAILTFIEKANEKVEDQKVNLEYLHLTLEDLQNQKKGTQRSIYKAINDLQDKIAFAEQRINEEQEKLPLLTDQINILEQEIQGGNFRGLYGSLQELKQERDWLANQIGETKDLLGKVKGLLKALLRVAKQLFPSFDFKYLDKKIFGDEIYGPQNKLNYDDQTVATYDEIKVEADKATNLQNLLDNLTKLEADLKSKYDRDKAEITSILTQTDNLFKDKYLDLTKAAPQKAQKQDPAIDAITKGLTSDSAIFPSGNNSGSLPYQNPEEGFDGSTYQRPLTTKFFTSTFPDYRNKAIKDLPKDVQDYFDFVELVTNENNGPLIKKKLPKGDLKVLIVTRNNVQQLGLQNVLKDRQQYFNIQDAASTHVEIVPVIEEGGYFFYTDKELNKLGRVDENKPSAEMVRTVLRLPRYTTEEQEQYSVKYSQEQMDEAVKAGTDWRQQLLDQTAADPIRTLDFVISRGIANKLDMQDGSLAQNPVSVILPESKINGQSVRVFSKPNVQINDENITIPVGRPFIYTTNGVHEQLHAADNKQLSPQQITLVSRVLTDLLKDHVEKATQRVTNSKTITQPYKDAVAASGINSLDAQMKREIYFAITKDKSTPSLFNSNYTNYLSSILHFNKLEKDDDNKTKTPGKNQIYIQGYRMFFGDSGISIDITDPESISSPEIQDFLKSQYHNIKYYPSSERANSEYLEYYLDGDKLQSRSWKTYAHYLLSSKMPDGSKRTDIPVTTAIKTQDQHSAEKGTEPYYTYLSRGIIVQTDAIPFTKRQVIVNKATNKPVASSAADMLKNKVGKNQKVVEVTDSQDTKITAADMLRSKMQSKSAQTVAKSTAITPTGTTAADMLRNKMKKPQQDVPDYNGDKESDTPSLPGTGMFRLAKGGVFQTEEDLDGVITEVGRILPQFPVTRLRNVIKTTDGQEAWGQFLNNVIYVHENGQKGTTYHEAFEAVVNRLLSDPEWSAIYKEFTGRKGSFIDRETGESLPYLDATPHQAKEQMAEEFIDYKNGKQPQQHQTRSFFKIIWDFVKSLFTNKLTIDNIFAKIDQGKFATTTVRDKDRFTTNYRRLLPELHAEVKRDLMDGATSFMFQNIFLSPESLTQLDEIELTDEQVYEPVKTQFQNTATYINYHLGLEKGKIDRDAKLVQDYNNSLAYINYTLDNWSDFVKAHKEDLKRFRIRFEEQEQTEEQKEQQNRNDYAQSEFKTPGKKSASKSVRFLFGTLIKKRFDEIGSLQEVGGKVVGATKNFLSSVLMPQLADYDKLMLDALDQFKGMSNMSDIEQKLKDLSGITEIEETKNPEAQKKLIAGLPQEKAIWTSLYVKLFGFSQQISPEASWNLKAKFQTYVSKHAPEPYIMIFGAGDSSIISATKRSTFESITKKIESSIISQSTLLFSRVKKGGVTRFVPVKALREKIPFDDTTTYDERGRKIFTEGFNPKKMKAFIYYLGLNDIITDDFIISLSKGDQITLKSKLFAIRNALAEVNTTTLSLRGLNIFGYTSKLIDFLDQKQSLSDLGTQYLDHKNEPRNRHITPSYISRIVGDFNNMSYDDLILKYPQLDSYFAQDSILLSKLFDKDKKRTDFQLTLGYMSAIKDIDENEGTGTAQLEFWDKYWLQFNAILKGLHYSLPADSETEWLFNMGEFITYSEDLMTERGKDIISTFFIPKLKSEIDTAINDSSNLLNLQTIHKSTGYTAGKSLRFFKDVLKNDPKLLKDIHTEMNEKGSSSEKIITDRKYRDRIYKAISIYISNEVATATATLLDNRLVTQQGDQYIIGSLDNSFVEKYRQSFQSDEGMITMSKAQFDGLVQYQKINSLLGLWEQFKLFYGDPAQYKDWEKRAKSLFGPIEQTFYDETGEFNNWLTKEKNAAVLGDQRVELPTTDWFRKSFSNKLTSRTVNDIEVATVETLNSLAELNSEFVSKFASQYEKSNEADGQSAGTLPFFRELMIKAGWRWAKEHENYFQYDTALMRQELSQLSVNDDHHYDYQGSNALKELDKKIIAHYRENPPAYPLSPVKPLMPSQNESGNNILLKHSVYPMSYQLAKGREMLDTYVDMLKRGDDLLNFKSAQKVGALVDNEGKITDYYQDPFLKNDLVAKGNPQFTVDYRTIGIQVETQTTGAGQTLGSQLSKDINLNLFKDGVPLDYAEGKDVWDSLSEEDKLASSNYHRLVYGENGTITSLEALKIKNTVDRFSELGINWEYTPEGLSYNIEDLTQVKQFIHDEMQRLQIDENSLENVELTEDLKAFLNPAETLPSYTTISNLLWSMADKATTSMKVNGKSYIQVASTFFNSSTRKAAYKDGNKWVVVDNADEYSRLLSKGTKMVMTSSELQFYRKGEDGKTLGMEILLPHIYKQRVNEKRKEKGLTSFTDQQLMDHLNSHPELLQGVGFRIPTQATSSLEFFTIKGFLPEAFGSSVVVPSAITTKAGSDFDVDKLNTYLNNWKMNSKGLPFYEDYKDDSNSTAQQRYDITFGKRKKFLNKIEEYLLKSYEREVLNEPVDLSASSFIDRIFGQVDDISFYNLEEIQEVLQESTNYRTVTYKDLLKKVQEDEKNIITLDRFQKLPIPLQNTKGALENRYFQSIRNILQLPEMFEYLLSPNSIDHIKENRDAVQKAINPDWVSEERRELDYTRFLSTEYIADKRNQFTKGKNDIGIFAVAMTNFANSQISGIGISELGLIKYENSHIFDVLNDSKIDLPFSDITMLERGNKWFISLSALKDRDGKLTMDKLSSYITGAVDVAKEPYIIEMGMHTELAGTYVLMERMGLTGKTAALFLYQPVIREFLKEILFIKGTYGKSYFGNPLFDKQKEVIEHLTFKYGGDKLSYNPDYKFTDAQLAEMIRKGELVKQGKAQWTASEKQGQYLAFVNFLKMRMYSQHLLENIQASNHDTASIRNPWIIIKKDLQLERSRKGNMIVKIENNKAINGATALRNDTFVKTDVNLLKNFNNLFSRMQLFALQKANPQSALIAVATRIYNQNPFISNDDFITAMRDYEASTIDSLTNDVLIEGIRDNKLVYNELHKFAAQYFKTESQGNIKSMYDYLFNLKKGNEFVYRDYMKNNFFLQNLQIFTDKNAGVDLMELKKKPGNDDVLTKERLTEGMRSMSQLDVEQFPEMVQFFKAMVYGAYLQFGIKFSRKSFVDLIPAEALSKLTGAGLANIDGQDFRTLDELVQRAKWHRRGVVVQQMQNSLHFISPTTSGEMVLEKAARSKEGSWKVPPTKISQIFFATDTPEGEIIPHIHPAFLWGGYVDDAKRWKDMPNIIQIPGVKPEFMVRKEAVFTNEDGTKYTRSVVYPDREEIKKMKKRGDYSYLFSQLYKKVGVEDPSLARQMISGGNKKSVNYLYKPINKQGYRDFNEIKPLLITPENTIIGESSIISNPAFREWEDNELISQINNTNGRLQPVVKPSTDIVTKSLGIKNRIQIEQKKEITFQPDNISKIESGVKTTTIRSINEASKIGLKPGETATRYIGDRPYLVTNRGFLTIEQAGGQESILKSEGLSSSKEFKYKQSLDWYNGKGKVYVYDIKKTPSIEDDITNLPKCK